MERDQITRADAERISIQEGTVGQIYTSFTMPGSAFTTRLAVLLGAQPIHFSLLSSIMQVSQLFQPLGAIYTRSRVSRRSFAVTTIATGRSLTILVGFLLMVLPSSSRLTVFLLILLLSTAFQAVGNNAWIAWISDLFPTAVRGTFLARRTQYLLVTGLLSGLLFGAIVDLFDPEPTKVRFLFTRFTGLIISTSTEHFLAVFAVLFLLTTIIGLLSTAILRNQPETNRTVIPVNVVKLLTDPMRDVNFRRLLFYGIWWMLAIGIGAPFWQPFMIRKLNMSVTAIQLYALISSISSFVVLRFWGRLIDRFGNKPAMTIAILLGGFNPMLWLFATPDQIIIIYLEAITSGIMWAGAGIVTTNFVLSVAPDDKRQIYAGLYSAFTGLAAMLTMLGSGIFIPRSLHIGALVLEPEQVLFAMTGIARWSTLLPLLLVSESNILGIGGVISLFQQFTKVRVLQVGQRIFHKDRAFRHDRF